MRITVTGPAGSDGGVLPPIDPPPPFDINQLFELEFLRVSANDVPPFQEVQVSWSIKQLGAIPVADYVFSLIAAPDVLATDIAPSGAAPFSPYRNTLFRIIAWRRGGTSPSSLGQGLVLRVNVGACDTLEIASSIIDGLATDGLSRLTSDTAELRLRRKLVSGPNGLEAVEMEVQSTWEAGVIKYHFPLEVVLNNFFNADLDVDLEIRFRVYQNGQNMELDVSIDHASEVDFDTIEDILSLGNSYTAAKTANRLIPLVLECVTPTLERDILRQMLEFMGGSLRTHRLVDVRVVPLETFSSLAIILCPLPDEPDDPDRRPSPVGPTIG